MVVLKEKELTELILITAKKTNNIDKLNGIYLYFVKKYINSQITGFSLYVVVKLTLL